MVKINWRALGGFNLSTLDDNTVVLGLDNPKSPSNVGSVMRAAGCYHVKEVHYTGARFDRAMKFQTDTKKSAEKIPLINIVEFGDEIDLNMRLVCVELVEGATPLSSFEHPKEAMYIFGPEDGSLPQMLIDRADYVVYVPTDGSMNLAATVNVVLYDRLSKSSGKFDDDALIRASRDTNNRLRVKTQKR